MASGLLTFLPPRRIATAATPVAGAAAPEIPGVPRDGRPRIVAFLRHAGCPFAEAQMRELRQVAASRPDLAVIAVGHADPTAGARWCQRIGGAGDVLLVQDPARTVYAAWGVTTTSFAHFGGSRSLRGVAALARRGIRNTRANGSRWQSAATFAVSPDGTVAWRHLPAHAADAPDLAAAIGALAA